MPLPQQSLVYLLSFVSQKKYGFVDQPNERKVHQKSIPRIGGVAILIGAVAGTLLISPANEYMLAIVVGAAIIVTIGLLDDKYDLSARVKLVAQIAAACIVVFSGLTIEQIYFPLIGTIELGFF